jgi:hypothetical protein
MGHQDTTIYLSQEYMKLMVDLLTSFVGPSQQSDSLNDNTLQSDDSPSENLFSVVAHIERVQCVLSDPVMGMHRPILSVCLPSLLLTASRLQIQQGPTTKIENLTGDTDAFNSASDLQLSVEVRGSTPFCSLRVFYTHLTPWFQTTIFIDYFKLGLVTRNWEELVEPLNV